MKHHHFAFLRVGLLAAVWFAGTLAKAQQSDLPSEVIAYADTVLFNGKVLQADDKFSTAAAIAIRDGRFLAVGDSAHILKMAGPKTQKIDLGGKTVVPGIIDLHQHPFSHGMQIWRRQKWIPNEPSWSTPEDALQGIKRAVARAKPGDLVIIPRTNLASRVEGAGGRAGMICDRLTREQIDSVSRDTPVFFAGNVNLTVEAINSKAASLIQSLLPKDVKSPFVFEGKSCIVNGGDVDGILTAGSQAVNDYIYWAVPLEDQMDAYRLTTKFISASGLTMVKEHTALPLMTGIRELWARGELTVRMRMPLPVMPTESGNTCQLNYADAERLFRRLGNLSEIGDDMLKFIGIRPPAVGGNVEGGDSWTLQAKTRPYPDRWGNDSPFGGRIQEQEAASGGELFRGRGCLVQAVRFGWDVSADHTIGDRAVREVVNAFEEGLKTQLVKRPNQHLTINHTPMADQADIPRMAKLGVDVSVGVSHLFAAPSLEAGLAMYGTERVNNMAPIKSYIDAGMHPVIEGATDDRPVFPRLQILITRKDEKYKRVWNPKEAVTRQQALWMATLWGAEQIGEKKKFGSIEPGKYADLLIVDKDYMTTPPDQIGTIKPVMTILGGNITFDSSKDAAVMGLSGGDMAPNR